MTKARDLANIISGGFTADDIPNLDTAKITSGTLDAARIDNNSLTNVTQLPFSAGTDWQSTIVTGTTLTAEAGKGYWIDTTSNACTVTLPASASVGDFIEFADYARTWGTNNVTINTNSLNFQGNSSPNPSYNTDGQSVKIIYSGATQGWIPSVDDDVTFETPQTVTADFLVIAGGGSGGVGRGGGGAGGYRNSYSTESSGGGASSETSLALNPGTTYTITVGAGGTAQTSEASAVGYQGNNSSISGSDITDIVSIGGGAGGGDGVAVGGDGGSGGGGGFLTPYQAGGSGTANQGYGGGDGLYPAPQSTGGGGGGASQAGFDGTTSGGSGGDGLASSITGSSVTRGGGGGGGTYQNFSGAGGAGGGGNGGRQSPVYHPFDGTANTGGGGGGDYSNAPGSTGGSGVVILRMATADYSGTTTGSPTVSTDGSDTILTFNASGSYTA